MKPQSPIARPLLVALLVAAPAFAGEGAHHAPKLNPAFDQLKTLVGQWEAGDDGGAKMREEITLTAGGSVLMESMFPGTPHAMITMYSPDGKQLVATHYCAAGNQPRMRSKGFGADGKTAVFTFVDATNLASPKESHMHKVEVKLIDADHFDATWTSKGEPESPPMTFHWSRVKSAAPAPAPEPPAPAAPATP